MCDDQSIATFRYEGESEWRPLQEIVDAFESQPASEIQRQRLRKHGVVFDEAAITRKQARELYRETPARKAAQKARDAAREERDRPERETLLTKVRNAGWSVSDDISLSELWTLQGSAPASNKTVQALNEAISAIAVDGFEIDSRWRSKLQGRLSETHANILLDYLREFLETSANLKEAFLYHVAKGILSREPTISEIQAMRRLLLAKLLDGNWEGTILALMKTLCMAAPDLRYNFAGDCSPPPAATDSKATIRIWSSDRSIFYNVVVTRDLGQTMTFCDCRAGKLRRLCKHVKSIMAGDREALWDQGQKDLLAQVSAWLK